MQHMRREDARTTSSRIIERRYTIRKVYHFLLDPVLARMADEVPAVPRPQSGSSGLEMRVPSAIST
jgi:hypothetical protein